MRSHRSPTCSELKGHVAQTADANDADLVRWKHTCLQQRIEYRDATAQQRTCLRRVEGCRNRSGPHPVTSYVRSKCSRPVHDRLLQVPAQIVIASEAGLQ